MSQDFKRQIKKAIEDPNLTGALGRFSEAYALSRAKAYEGIDFQALRQQIAAIKGDAAGKLEELAEEFTRQATAKGAHGFRTSQPEEVRAYILNLAAEKGLKRVVKSKSMASEEIHLNQALIQAGLEVKETDLGEWIIQLAGQRPSHMVMPAIHLTKEEVAEIFSKEVKERLAGDIPRLVKVARRELRQKFLEADIGISGANIAVAQTGTLVIITNEGNARLVTSLPRVHVAIVGLEKLIERFEDIAPILTALPKSATSQLLTSYVTMITGPVPNTDGTPKDLHIILLDNHRTEMAADPVFKQALQCIRCASCLNVCPVFRLVGGHVFGDVYTGGIGTVLTAWFDQLKKTEDIQGLCIGCGNCKEVCPACIDIPELIMELRRRLDKKTPRTLSQKAAYAVVNNRRLFHGLLRAASLASKPLAKDGFIRHLPQFLGGDLASFRSLPAIAAEPLRDLLPRLRQPQGRQKALFYAGCLIDFAYPGVGQAVVEVLNKAGIEVAFPQGQTCCGAPARYAGAVEVAAKNARDNIEALLETPADYVVSACPTCTVALKEAFGQDLEAQGLGDWLPRARELAAKTWDFSSLVRRLVDEGRLALPAALGLEPCTYHDSCHLKRSLGVQEEPRQLLIQAGYPLREMFESDMCCGMGGSYALKFPEIAQPMLERKLHNIAGSGAGTVALDCPGCLMQIQGGLDKQGSPLKVRHTAELLAQALGGLK
ncbi:MAG: LUD domain-containing protein [Desulfarculus sp.]|nr:LUD domain-containing protein [Desulfarculus sp.]